MPGTLNIHYPSAIPIPQNNNPQTGLQHVDTGHYQYQIKDSTFQTTTTTTTTAYSRKILYPLLLFNSTEFVRFHNKRCSLQNRGICYKTKILYIKVTVRGKHRQDSPCLSITSSGLENNIADLGLLLLQWNGAVFFQYININSETFWRKEIGVNTTTSMQKKKKKTLYNRWQFNIYEWSQDMLGYELWPWK